MGDRRRRRESHRVADLPDAGRIAATGDRRADHFQDGALTLRQTRVRRSWRVAGVAHVAECSRPTPDTQTFVRGVSLSRYATWRTCRCRLIEIDQMFGIRTHDRLYSNTRANRSERQEP